MTSGNIEKLADVLAAIKHYESDVDSSLAEGKITILRNFTVEGIEPFIKFQLFRSGIRPTVQIGNYDNITQDLMVIKSGEEPPPDLTVIALVLESLDVTCYQANWTADLALEQLTTFWEIAKGLDCRIAVNTFPQPLYPDDPLQISNQPGSISRELHRLNTAVRDFALRYPGKVFLCDIDQYLRRTGEAGLDPRYWYLSRSPFKPTLLSHWASDLATILRTIKGKNRKCLVLDCDNTLWGGILGEDGVAGIQLDPHEYPGRAYFDFQAGVIRLANAGVMIALCSKNNEADVFEVLDSHENCLLKREHLAGSRINWQDKATNLLALSEELNIGLDAMVFVDDNPAECALVEQQLPSVKVLPVPEDIYNYPTFIQRQQLFSLLSVSNEDSIRTKLYQQEKLRKSEQEVFIDLDSYLSSLQMVATIHSASTEEIPRIAQLTQKTNQFNLTTRRYSENDIARFCADANSMVFSLTVSDRFGDLGLIGVLIAHKTEETVVIDSLLISCRALGRLLEKAFLYKAINVIQNKWSNITLWQAEYLPTRKNIQVENFWGENGFEKKSTDQNGTVFNRHNEPGVWINKPEYITLAE